MKPSFNRRHNSKAWDLSREEEAQLRAKQVAVLYDQSSVGLTATVAAALFLVVEFWAVTPHPILLAWFVLITVITALRLGLIYKYKRSPDRTEQANYWLAWFIAGTAVSGTSWGLTAIILVPGESLVHMSFALLWIGALSAGTVGAYSIVTSVFLAFSLPALIPNAFYLLITGGSFEATISGGIFMYFGFLLLNALRMHKTLLHGLKLQFENTRLIEHLDVERESIKKLNDQLEKRVTERTADLSKVNLYLQQEITERKRIEQALRESESRLRQVLQNMPVMLSALDADGNVIVWNRECERVTGYSASEIVNDSRSPKEVPPNVGYSKHGMAEWAKQGNNYRSWEWQLIAKDGCLRTITWANISKRFPVPGWATWGTGIDITQRKQAEEKLRQAAVVFENTAEGVMITDAEGRIVAVNRAFTEITGYEQEEVLGKTASVLHSEQHDEQFYAAIWASIKKTGRWQGELWNRRKNGEVYPEWLNISSVLDDQGYATHYVSVFSDITPIKKSQEQLEHLAHHDPLTGLPNRLLFHARVEHAMERARREGERMAVLFFDLDHFKHINDSLGHPAGDRLLQEVTRRLLATVRKEDTVARLGGDEFTILLEGLSAPRDAGTVAEKALKALAKPFDLEGHEAYITGSVGISLYPDDGEDVTTLLKNADSALYRGKEQGRNTYQFYTEDLTVAAFKRLAMESSLRHAVEHEEFTLYYQPQISLKNGRVVGAEALVRWQHPELGLMLPAKFIPLSEETGLIVKLGEWILQSACTQAKAWLEAGLPPLRVAVNVSSIQVTRGRITDMVKRVLEETSLEPHYLELEITEGVIMQQTNQTVATLDALKAMGVMLAIDDFGTGYSSLSYLKRLPLHRLKIDRSFVHDIPHSSDDVAITRAVIALGDSLELIVAAEGVETEAQLEVLRIEGCDEAQGYLYSVPVPAAEFAELVRSLNGTTGTQTTPTGQKMLCGG